MAGAGSVAGAVRETGTAMSLVFRRPQLRRLTLALAGSLIGDWAYSTAVAVWAYGVGGASAVGIWGTIRLTLMAIGAPFGAALADRMSRRDLMVACDAIRFALVIEAAALVQEDGSVAVVFVLATLAPLVGTPFRPAQLALTPSLVQDPRELTAANGVGSTLESTAFFVGPAIAGLLLAFTDVAAVFAFNALTFLLSAVLVRGLPQHPAAEGAGAGDPGAAAAAEPSYDGGADGAGAVTQPHAAAPAKPSFLAEALAGFRTIRHNSDLLLVTVTYCAQTVVAGASLVFGVAIAFDLTGLGASGVGLLDAMLGVGAILGGFLAIGLGARQRLASDFGFGVVLWAAPLLLIAAFPGAAAALAAMAIIGAANPVVDINATTIIQRVTPDAVLGRVFGALESGLIAGMALGSVLMPLLIAGPGLRAGLAIVAVPIVVIGLAALPRLRGLDSRLAEPESLPLLASAPLFAPLQRTALEALARATTRLEVAAGTDLVREGDDGDRFYVVASGLFAASYRGDPLSTMGPGECFGELALLRDVPRTATVTALEDSVVHALERDDFLAGLSGDVDLMSRTESLAARRIPTA